MRPSIRFFPLFALMLLAGSLLAGNDRAFPEDPSRGHRPDWRKKLPRLDLDIRGPSGVVNDTKDGEELNAFIAQFVESHKIAGLSAAAVKEGEVIWTGAFGHADFTPVTPTDEDHLFMLASITKTVTGCALMTLYDQGLFGLDDSVNHYLPFIVKHPVHPGTDITIRMLLTHTSGIKDNWGVMPYYPGDSPIPLGTYLNDYLVPGGAYYNAQKNYYSWKPGTNDGYCNIAVALAGYLVETISGMPLEDYCQSNLFAPLGMDNTSYFLANLDTRDIAMPCYWNGSKFVAYGHYGYSDYPSGQLRTSAPQLLMFLTSFMQNQYPAAVPDSILLLRFETAQLMTTPQDPQINPSQGLVWYQWTFNGRPLWGHNGGDQGVSTGMWFWPEKNIGVVVLTNGESGFVQVLDAIFQYAENI